MNEKMYGRLTVHGSKYYAHRLSKMVELGRKLRADEVVMHQCNNPNCVNPAHLEVGSILINNDHRKVTMRSLFGRIRAQT